MIGMQSTGCNHRPGSDTHLLLISGNPRHVVKAMVERSHAAALQPAYAVWSPCPNDPCQVGFRFTVPRDEARYSRNHRHLLRGPL